MGKYVDGFVLVVPKDKIEDYKKMALEGAEIWMKYGALEYMECMGDDLTTKEMERMRPVGFTEMTKADQDETVWFSFIVYRSKEHRDEVNAKVMEEMAKDERYQDASAMPFDMKRFSVGGFTVKVEG
jgi:uncharacterized protein YbaA (DUF1428 family)